jgi:hypothetical protein
VAVVGIVIGMTVLGGRTRSLLTPSVATHAAVESAMRSCKAKVQPELRGPVDRWQLTDEVADPQAVTLTFAADVGGKVVTYRCDVTPSGAVIAAIGGP